MGESQRLWTRRTTLGAALLLTPAAAFSQKLYAEPSLALKELEKRTGSHIGVAALDSASGKLVSWREGERFIMCSTFKFSLAAAVLARADAGKENLDRLVRYSSSDLLLTSPATTRNVAIGMRIVDLCQAIILYSDNTAANLLLGSVGGPEGVTRWWREIGDDVTRLDRHEPELNVPDGDKDTTTPAAMLGDLKAVLLDKVLSQGSRARLMGWLAASTTGARMLRAGVPKTWSVGDKTGRWTSRDPAKGATNDIGILMPPGRGPILVAAYTMGGKGDDAGRQSVLADIGRIIADHFA